MRRLHLTLFSLCILWAAACSPFEPAVEADRAPAQPVKPAESGAASGEGFLQPPSDGPVETAAGAAVCLEGEPSPIGESIAQDYAFTDYAEIMSWFCMGAEFEDILTALETEALSAVPAEETLQMVADGFTWDEVWQLIGLSE